MSEPNCVQKLFDGPTGKKWTLVPCLLDHAMFLKNHGRLLLAYVGCCGCAAAIEHDLVEKVMVAVNSVNECPYCDGLHGQLARMAGVEDAEALRCQDKSCKSAESPAVKFAKTFGQGDGRGEVVDAAFKEIVEAEGATRAASIRALAMFLMWGSLTGNTINCTKKRLILVASPLGLTPFSLLFFLWYGPLFFLVFVVNSALKLLPKMATQAWFFKVMGVVLWTLAGIWIAPVGLIGLLISPCASYPAAVTITSTMEA